MDGSQPLPHSGHKSQYFFSYTAIIVKKYLLLAVSLLMTCCADSLHTPLSLASATVVRIESVDGGHGTGFVFHDNRTVVTAGHVLRYIKAHTGVCKLTFSDGDEIVCGPESFTIFSDMDLAVVRLPRAAKISVRLHLSAVPATVGDTICGVGYPLGYDTVAFSGMVSGSDGPNNTVSSAIINPGQSGSAVLNVDGRVVGVVVAKSTETEVINFYLDWKRIRKYLRVIDES